jgi:hypothetical protein
LTSTTGLRITVFVFRHCSFSLSVQASCLFPLNIPVTLGRGKEWSFTAQTLNHELFAKGQRLLWKNNEHSAQIPIRIRKGTYYILGACLIILLK